ncbi:MAG: hypothetical protein JXQ93_02665 [Flavobacteriaceae bacterium]
MITNQEEKFTHVLEEVSDSITEQAFFNTFLKLYPEDWKQLKINFSKFNRSKKFGKTIPLPKPEEAVRKAIRIWLRKRAQNS